MRVLWFSVTPSLFNPHSNCHNGGGWIASLEQIVRNIDVIKLGVAFYFGKDHSVYEKDDVKYYTLPNDGRSLLARIIKPEKVEERIRRYLKVIDDFKPDLIQIFGSENDFGLICGRVDIPVVIHMQGSLPPYHNALFPVGMNSYDFIFRGGLKISRRFIGLRSEKSFAKKASREVGILQNCRYFMGRTEWDRNIVELYNPNARYYHCEEALRDSFVNGKREWQGAEDKFRIVSVISTPWYKGVDLILKTAKLLKSYTQVDFEWNVFGIRDIRFFENKYGIEAKDSNVYIRGSVDKDKLVEELCTSSVYVHPSYIDNSPNSLCEAQYLGVPVVATNVGGISSLVKDGVTGLLVPANDPFTLASRLVSLKTSPDKAKELGLASRTEALMRHNPEKIGRMLLDIYESIVGV